MQDAWDRVAQQRSNRVWIMKLSRLATPAQTVSEELDCCWQAIYCTPRQRLCYRSRSIIHSDRRLSNIGNDCVAILEALSETVYVHDKHKRGEEVEPSIASTKARLDRFIEVELVGSDNAELRKLARAAIEFAQAVKHRRAAVSRTEAGLAADAVILIANILRPVHLSM